MKVAKLRTLALAALLAAGFGPSNAAWALNELVLEATPDANQNSATRVDAVFVYSAQVQALLPKSAPEWFATKQSLIAAAGAGLEVVSADIAPAMVYTLPLPKRHRRAVAVLVYTNVASPDGQAVRNIAASRKMRIIIQASQVRYRPD